MTELLPISTPDQRERQDTGMLKVSLRHHLGDFQLEVDFQVPLGLIVLFGPSGAGKSLTLRSLAGLLRPERGSLEVDGHVLLDSEAGINLPPQQRRVGYVPQHYALFPHLTVADNIAFGLPRRSPWPFGQADKKARQAYVADLLTALELEGLERRLPATLSGGQQQRVALARALAATPRLLLLDEPFNALDAIVRARLREALRQFQRRFAVPIVLVTHDRAEAQQLADTMIVIQHGRVAQLGTSDAIFRAPRTPDIARLIGQRNLFTGRISLADDPQSSVPKTTIRVDSLLDVSTRQRSSLVQEGVPDEGLLLPYPLASARSADLLAPERCLAGCILADELLLHRWSGNTVHPQWTTRGSALWRVTVVDVLAQEYAIRLLLRPHWASQETALDPAASGDLEIYLSRRQWRAIETVPGGRLLLEIPPEAVHCFKTGEEAPELDISHVVSIQ